MNFDKIWKKSYHMGHKEMEIVHKCSLQKKKRDLYGISAPKNHIDILKPHLGRKKKLREEEEESNVSITKCEISTI